MKTASILAVALLSASHLAASDFSISASLDREHSLPGIPVTVRLDVTNGGRSDARVPRLFSLGVTPATGEAFAAGEMPEDRLHTIPGYYTDDDLTVAPGATRRFELPLGETLASGWFADRRLWTPERYELEVIVGEKLNEKTLNEAIQTRSFMSGVFRSNAMELTVEALQGDEAEVWNLILARTDGRGPARTRGEEVSAIAFELFDAGHPNRYTPYLGVLVRIGDEAALARHFETILDGTPSEHPVAQQLRLAHAQLELKFALKRLEQQPDDASAQAQLHRAYAEIQTSAALESNAAVQHQAAEAISRLANNARIQRYRASE